MDNLTIKKISKLKEKKYRKIYGKFLIEGEHLVVECLKSKYYKDKIDTILIREDCERKFKHIKSVNIKIIPENIFKKISDTVNSQGIAAIVNSQKNDIKNFSIYKKSGNIIPAFDRINDPGNLGTILRTCWWFDVGEIILSKGSVDIFNPKVIRSTQGAFFNVKIYTEQNLESVINYFSSINYNIFAAEQGNEILMDEIKIDKKNNYLLIFGNEATGLSEEIKNNNKIKKFSIEPFSNCESLNIAIAAGIVIHHFKTEK
jgi:TrmH family RNA methyltransferase